MDDDRFGSSVVPSLEMLMLVRRRVSLLLAAAALPALAACGGGSGQTAQAPASASSSASGPAGAASSPASSPASAGAYVDHATYRADPGRYADGKIVLFFHASWCPSCKQTDANLTADPGSIPAGLTIVKTDFDAETDLRKQYGVTQQHTFVSIGPDGAKQAVWSGTFTAAEIAAKAV